jgi:hypothetical protein
MVDIFSLEEYSLYNEMVDDFINSFHVLLTEDVKKSRYKEVQKKIFKDLKLNVNLVGIYGAGIGALYPIVEKLMSGNLNIEITPETVVLSTICAITVIYMEEKKIKNPEKTRKMVKDSKSMLEELRMMGVGDGIIKKIIKCFYVIKNIFTIIGKHIGAVVSGFIDLFSYLSIMIPMLNAILFIIGKYDLNLDTLVKNFIGLSMGIGTLIAKHGIIDIINRIKSRFPLKKKEILDEIETPVMQKFDKTYGKGEEDKESEIIQEQ